MTYLGSARASLLDPTAWLVYAALVARCAGKDGPFVVSYRRRSIEHPVSLQDLTCTAVGGPLGHATISDATRRLVEAELVRRLRTETKRGATDGPGTPYQWSLRCPDDQRSFRWPMWSAALLAVIEKRLAGPREAYALARLCELANRDGVVVASVSTLAARMGMGPKTIRRILDDPHRAAWGITRVEAGRKSHITLDVPSDDAVLKAEQCRMKRELDDSLQVGQLIGFARGPSSSKDKTSVPLRVLSAATALMAVADARVVQDCLAKIVERFGEEVALQAVERTLGWMDKKGRSPDSMDGFLYSTAENAAPRKRGGVEPRPRQPATAATARSKAASRPPVPAQRWDEIEDDGPWPPCEELLAPTRSAEAASAPPAAVQIQRPDSRNGDETFSETTAGDADDPTMQAGQLASPTEVNTRAVADARTISPAKVTPSDVRNGAETAASVGRPDVVAVQLRLDGKVGRELVEHGGRLEYRELIDPPNRAEKTASPSDAELLFAGAPAIADGEASNPVTAVLDPNRVIVFPSDSEAHVHEVCDALLVWYQVGNSSKVSECEGRLVRAIHRAVGVTPAWTTDEFAAWCRLMLKTGERLMEAV